MSANLSSTLFLVTGILFILALRGLSSPETSRMGNLFGILGMALAIVVSILSVDIFLANLIYFIIALTIGGSIGAVNKEIRACKLAWMFPNKHTEWIYQRITDVVNQTNEEIFKFDLTKMETFQFTKYKEEESGFYDKHVDPMVGQYLPENRKLSLVVQLSDPDDYEGGDLCLYTGKDPTIIEKKRGRVVFFPSYTLHEVKPVTKGTRYTLVGWVHGPAFK